MKTNKETLVKGLKHLGIALILMFLGPTLLYIVIGNQDSSTYIPLLIIGFIICIVAIIMGFKGINIIMESMFNNKKS